MDIQAQLAELFIRAVPTLILLIVLYVALDLILFQPLKKTLAERHRLTEGAQAAAQQARASAQQSSSEYEDKVRAVKTEMYRELEEARRRAMADQQRALDEARHRASELVSGVQHSLDEEAAQVRGSLINETEAVADRLAEKLIAGRAV